MSQAFRLATGGRIDRATSLRFQLDGHDYVGHRGDTLASALLANGTHLVGRSFKYHRPRGILSAGAEEPNALVSVDRGGGRYDPNMRATEVALFEGLRATTQNRWPSLRFDAGAIAGSFAGLIPAGFYYKTFMWPGWAWHKLYEPAIRAMAGLGRAPTESDPDRYAARYAHCDVLVVGAGPAGLAAALAASEAGARVIVCDEQDEPGGSLLSRPGVQVEGKPAWTWLANAVGALRAAANVRLLARTTSSSYQVQNFVALVERVADHAPLPCAAQPRQRLWQVRARQVVLATGAIERPLIFPANDRPGIMLAGAVRTYVNRYAVLPGRKAVAVASHDDGYRAALDFARAGGEVAAIVDARAAPPHDLSKQAQGRGIEVVSGHVVTSSKGRARVAAVSVGRPDANRANDRWIGCDLVMMAGGFTPSVHLFSQSRGKLRWDAAIDAFVPGVSVQAQKCVGACAGDFSLASCIAQGAAAGLEAARAAMGRAASSHRMPGANELPREAAGASSAAAPRVDGPMAFVDFQNDVTSKDVELAVREGMRSVEHVKRYTTLGMATDQGKTSGLNGLAVAAGALGAGAQQVGLTTFRPPYTPVAFGTLVGQHREALFDVVQCTPIHAWAQDHGAVFEDVGAWKRARYFPRPSEDMRTAVNRECRQTRTSVGMFDGSTLGKIEVVGPDAAEFLNRMYVNSWTKLAVGRCRYGIMLREDGCILDDGVVGRLADDRFHVTTTTGGAARVLHVMEDYLQTEFADLRVWLTSVTEHWAVIAVNGPNARALLQTLVDDLDLSRETFPHMSMREGTICGVPMRLFRVSFTGELGFEINIPSDYGRFVWERIHAAGERFGIVAYGTEAMHVLRAEKGYIIVGQEADGTVTPADVGLEWAIGKGKHDFVGKRSLSRAGMLAPGRKQLVGLRTKDRKTVLDEGAALVEPRSAEASSPMLGHVTSAYWSETLAEPIALALVKDGRSRMGATLIAPTEEGDIEVEVTSPVFYDPQGDRLDA